MKPNELNFESAIDILKHDCIKSEIAFNFAPNVENGKKYARAGIQRVDCVLELLFDISNIREIIGSSAKVLFDGISNDIYKFGESHLGDSLINLSVSEEICAQSMHDNICTAKLKEISYQLPESDFVGKNYYRLSDSGRVIIGQLGKLSKVDEQQNIAMGMFNNIPFNATYIIEEDKDKNKKTNVYLQYDGEINDLLLVLSFFFCTPIYYDKLLTTDEDGKVVVYEESLRYWTPVNSRNQILGYLFSKGVSIMHLRDFLPSLPPKVYLDEKVQKYIEYYLRAENVDEISRLTIYSSILEIEASAYIKLNGINLKKVLNKQDINSFDRIKYFLNEELKIDSEKINDNISTHEICDDKEKVIIDFYKLRNFFTHYHGSKKAEDFLNESEILFFLKETVTILILKLLGVESVLFDSNFQHLSVFSDNVEQITNE